MRKQKQGKKGEVARYISRSKAIRKLQLSLKDFRKMCILKGVYPREPPKKLKKHNRTYYHIKDINFLALDPLLTRLRAQKVYLRRFRRAKARGDLGKVRYLASHKPKMSLNHLVRERYPDFLDALRDLDDPLSLIALFSIFPTHKDFGLSRANIQLCGHLMKHLELYVIHTRCLKKAFVSIKGIYYQLEIMGTKITYIDVDYRVMCTFLDFYIVLVKFVLFKLYSIQQLEYPPTVKETSDAPTYDDYILEKIQSAQETGDRYQIDHEFADKPQNDENLLFSRLRFYLSTEVPRYSLEFIILAEGGALCSDPNDPTITHYITDRENLALKRTREYVQPQWVYDSLNFNRLLNVQEYWVGKELPSHISPFGDENDSERYIPQRELELKQLEPSASQKTKELKGKILEAEGQDNQFDIVEEKKKEKRQKRQDQKEFVQISKGLISNKNRKLLKGIQAGKNKKQEAKNRLITKAQKLKH